MPASTQPRTTRPHGAPAYYLGRPAYWWITAIGHRRIPGQQGQTTRLSVTTRQR